MQMEQVAQVQIELDPVADQPHVTSAGTTILPATASFGTTAADSDPSGTTPNYQVSAVDPGDGSNQFASGGGSFVQVQNAAADSGQAISATAAGGSNTCPPTPPAPPAETDLQPCGGARVLQAGTSRVVGPLPRLHGGHRRRDDRVDREPRDRLHRVHEPDAGLRAGRQHPGDGEAHLRDRLDRWAARSGPVAGRMDRLLPPADGLSQTRSQSTAGTSAAAPSGDDQRRLARLLERHGLHDRQPRDHARLHPVRARARPHHDRRRSTPSR